jgi:hypothetical protein
MVDSKELLAYHDSATRIVFCLSDHNFEAYISKEIAQFVFKPFLERNLSNAIRIIYKLPEKWFNQDNKASELAN